MGRLFELKSLHIFIKTVVAAIISSIWRGCLGHPSGSRVGSLISSGCLGLVKQEHVDYVSCQLSKHHALPFSKSDSVSSAPFDLIHFDIWGPHPNITMGSSHYFVFFVHDYSRFTSICLIQNRSELPSIYLKFANMITT